MLDSRERVFISEMLSLTPRHPRVKERNHDKVEVTRRALKGGLALFRYPRYETIICRLGAQQLERVDYDLEPPCV